MNFGSKMSAKFALAAIMTLLVACGRNDAIVSTPSDRQGAGEDPAKRSSLQVHLSEEIIAHAVFREVNETREVNEWMMDAWIYGTAEQKGKTQVELRPSDDKALVDTLYYADTITNVTGQRDPATFWTTAHTSSGTRKQGVITIDGSELNPAMSNANTATTINGLNVDVFLFHNIAFNRAWNELQCSLPQSNMITSERTAAEINARMDAETPKAIEESGLSEFQAIAKSLRDEAQLGDRVRFSTTEEALRLLVTGITGQPSMTAPEFGAGSDMALLLHESVVKDISAKTFGGKTLTKTEIDQQMARLFGPLMPATDEPDAAFSITFPAQDPIATSIDDDSMTIIIRGDQFISENKTYEIPMEIKATYRVDQGARKIVRTGEIVVLPPGFDPAHDTMTIKQQVLAAVLKEKMVTILKSEYDRNGLVLPGKLASAGKLDVKELKAEGGWLLVAWKMPAQ